MKFLSALSFTLFIAISSFASTKTAIVSGNWNSSAVWSPAGIPNITDDIIIGAGKNILIDSTTITCKSIKISSSASLTTSLTGKLIIASTTGLEITGTLENNGTIEIPNTNTILKLYDGGKIIWNPYNNTLNNLQLFTNCNEQLEIGSTLLFKKWFDTKIGIGDFLTGPIGNMTISGIWNWNMGESLRNHPIKGILSLNNSYAIIDSSNSNAILSIYKIEIHNSNTIVDIFKGQTGIKTINCNNISINGGQLNLSSGNSTASVDLITSSNVTINGLGTLCGSYQNDANSTISINGNLDITKSQYYGVYQGSGNHALTIGGNITLLKSGTRFSEFHGIYNGNGNISVNITGDFNHQGYSDLILNDGITGVGNGNASLTIGGHFQQNSGDFRGVFNLTSYNAGNCEFTCKDLKYSGGIFMLYYACSNISKNNILHVTGNLNVNFTNNNDIFRCNGLSNLNGTISNAQLELTIDGNSSIEGNNQCEFLSNTAYGKEDIKTFGEFKILGGITKFNYSPHQLTWTQNGDFKMSGGQFFTALESGLTTITFKRNFEQNAGKICFKNKSGNTSIFINGNFTLNGGQCQLYDNISQPLSNNIQLNIDGDFTQESGTIDFCNNNLSTGNTSVKISGSNYRANGGEIICSAQGNYFGSLDFGKTGILDYYCNQNHNIKQIKQTISSNCKLIVQSGNYQISTGLTAANDYLKIRSNAELNLNNENIFSSGMGNFCGITMESNSILKTSSPIGTGVINFPTGISAMYNIDKLSTIELNGPTSEINSLLGQTGITVGQININLDGNGIADLNTDLNIESQLILSNGQLRLNKNKITIQNNQPTSINRINGLIICNEKEGAIKWKNIQATKYEIPFGTSSGKYIPAIINCISGIGNDITANTISTSSDNNPLPLSLSSNPFSLQKANEEQIDRWWKIDAAGIIADITLSYASEENSTDFNKRDGNFSIQYKKSSGWSEKTGNATGVTSNTGCITAKGIVSSSYFMIVSNGGARSADITSFIATEEQRNCALKWETLYEMNCKEFIIERSTDNNHFSEIKNVPAVGNSIQANEYKTYDTNLSDGKYFYRLKVISTNGAIFYSESQIIEIGQSVRNQENLNIKSVFPNPFSNKFTVSYHLNTDAISKFRLISTTGQTLFTSEKQDLAGENTFEYNDELRLPPGYYLLNVISGTQTFTSKVYKNAY